MPRSADFYSGGRAKNAEKISGVPVLSELSNGREDFYVIEKISLESVPGELLHATHYVGENNDYKIYQETPAR
jgi:hypothetical protein